MLDISPAQRRELRAAAHHLQPVVSVAANGLTESVMKEIERSLKAHELIKIRVYGDDRALRESFLATLCEELGCAAVQHIGKLLVVFRPNPELKKPAPKAASTPKPATKPARKSGFGDKTIAAKPDRRPAPRKPGSTPTRGTRGAARVTSGRPARRSPAKG
jgi:RNA-binding protein